MTELLTAAQMRAIEEAAIRAGTVTGLELMERAGEGVVEAILAQWLGLRGAGHSAIILCGPGNNGGDGFVVARLLKNAGWDVKVVLFGDVQQLPPDARTNHDAWCQLGEVETADQRGGFHFRTGVALVIDALFGIGLNRSMAMNDTFFDDFATLDDPGLAGGTRVVAIDIPSGLSADSGEPFGNSLFADLTVTFHRKKVGHVTGQGPKLCGKVVVADIGLGEVGQAGVKHLDGQSVSPGMISKSPHAHKYAHGHALVLSGGVGQGGAARLAARGALRIGAGLVTLGCPPAALLENAIALDAVMTRKVADSAALEELLLDTRINALCIGPGLGMSDERHGLIEAGLKSARATVLDADALTLIGRDPTLFGFLHLGCVLTPHAGEFARLFPDLPTTRAASRIEAVQRAAARAGCTVLLKGADTVIASPDGQVSINTATCDDAAPWLATAGSGDVLAGFITGLLARGFEPTDAAQTAVWLHAEAARSFGPGLIAEDLPGELPKVFRALGL